MTISAHLPHRLRILSAVTALHAPTPVTSHPHGSTVALVRSSVPIPPRFGAHAPVRLLRHALALAIADAQAQARRAIVCALLRRSALGGAGCGASLQTPVRAEVRSRVKSAVAARVLSAHAYVRTLLTFAAPANVVTPQDPADCWSAFGQEWT